jgi:riboflavin synthase
MFTGLVQETGTVRALERSAGGARMEIEARLASELEGGASIAVSGVCLTAAELGPGRFAADVMAETLARSSLGSLVAGDGVNLELPLRAGDRLGGHFVQGHVDGLGTAVSIVEEGIARRVSIQASPELCRYVVDKGSVCVDGVSLTAIAPTTEGFAVALVPETLRRTTLGALEPGRPVNLELDLLAKYVERLLGSQGRWSGPVAVPDRSTTAARS